MMYTSAKPYFYGTGRRKKSTARVRILPGTGVITINGRDIDDYFGLETMKLIKQVFGDNHFVKIFYNVFVAHCTSPSSNSSLSN